MDGTMSTVVFCLILGITCLFPIQHLLIEIQEASLTNPCGGRAYSTWKKVDTKLEAGGLKVYNTKRTIQSTTNS